MLLFGETGTGKGLLARRIHADSPRRAAPFVELNCAGLQRELTESELFGHERGSFTGASERKIGLFEAAQGGTLLLDEIGEMDLPVQAKLLHVQRFIREPPHGETRRRLLDTGGRLRHAARPPKSNSNAPVGVIRLTVRHRPMWDERRIRGAVAGWRRRSVGPAASGAGQLTLRVQAAEAESVKPDRRVTASGRAAP